MNLDLRINGHTLGGRGLYCAVSGLGPGHVAGRDKPLAPWVKWACIQLNLRYATTLCARKSGLLREVVSHGRYSTVIKGRDRPTRTPNPC